jgi:hypothetical protein
MRIKIIGNDIEIDGEKVARILDIRQTLMEDLEAYIDKADTYDDIDDELSKVKSDLSLQFLNYQHLQSNSQDFIDSAFQRGYREGKDDAAT